MSDTKKKISKKKSPSAPESAKPSSNGGLDLLVVFDRMQERLSAIEKKLDTLLERPAARPAGFSSERPPFRERPDSHYAPRTGHSFLHGKGSRDQNYQSKVLTKAVCSECGKGCEVPFKPSGTRPVYCKACFSQRDFEGRGKRDFAKGPHFKASREKFHKPGKKFSKP